MSFCAQAMAQKQYATNRQFTLTALTIGTHRMNKNFEVTSLLTAFGAIAKQPLLTSV